MRSNDPRSSLSFVTVFLLVSLWNVVEQSTTAAGTVTLTERSNSARKSSLCRECSYSATSGDRRSEYYSLPNATMHGITFNFAMQIDILKLFKPCQRGSPRQSIVIFGGSMTGGALCSEGQVTNKRCAWPARFERWIRQLLGDCITVYNFARGGTQSEVALSMIPVTLNTFMKQNGQHPTLVITDFSVNDVYEMNGNVGRNSLLSALGEYSDQEKGAAVAESLIITLRNLTNDKSRTRHWMMLSHHPKSFEDAGLMNAHERIARLHGVPVFDTRSLWPSYWRPKGAHPDFRTHELLASLLARSICSSCTQSDAPQFYARSALRDKLPSCTRPTTVHSAYDHASPIDEQYVGEWKLIQDRPSKPGWVATVANSTLTLPVRFGATPLLMVNYLRSYEGMACVNMSMNGLNVTLDGAWSKRVSTTASFFSQAYANTIQAPARDDNHYGIIGFNVRPNSAQNISFTLIQCLDDRNSSVIRQIRKFKLIDIITC